MLYRILMTQKLLFDVLCYLSPALVLAVAIRYFSGKVLTAWFLQLPGTVAHECLVRLGDRAERIYLGER